MSKGLNSAIRRHHYSRLKVKRSHYWGGILNDDNLGFIATTPKACSCYGCGNPRKFWGELTIQERRQFDE